MNLPTPHPILHQPPNPADLNRWLDSLTDRELTVLSLHQGILVDATTIRKMWSSNEDCLAELRDRGLLIITEVGDYLRRILDREKDTRAEADFLNRPRLENSPDSD